MALTLMYITKRPDVAMVAERYGVDRIWVDLETRGKHIRQYRMNSVQSDHTIGDIYAVKRVLTKAKCLVRINPWHDMPYLGFQDSYSEIDDVVEAGADMIMLPMWRTVDEVVKFVEAVNSRAKTILLLETKEAEQCLDGLLTLYKNGGCSFDEIHIGLNDLHISYGLDFLFELLTNGTVERISAKLKSTKIPFGFGGIAKLGDGAIPAEKIIMEHYRLGSTRAILSRTFCDNALIDDIDEIDRVFKWNLRSLRNYEQRCRGYDLSYLLKNREELKDDVARVVVSLRKKREQGFKQEILSLREQYGEAFYILSVERFENNYIDLKNAFKRVYSNFNIAYSYKTNYLSELCKKVKALGGLAEVVSEFELDFALNCGNREEEIIWNGPIKSLDRIEDFLLRGGNINVDSLLELEDIIDIAERHPNINFSIGIRCNFPIGDGQVSRFGIDVTGEDFTDAIDRIQKTSNIRLFCIQCHYAPRVLQYWEGRVNGIIDVVERIRNEIGYIPERIDLGGGIYGRMPECMQEQFEAYIPGYEEYAEIVRRLADYFGEKQPELIIEPGSALVGDSMQYVCKVCGIKKIRGKQFVTVLGSQKNINMSGVNPPIRIVHTGEKENEVKEADIVGYTCIESDVLYHNYSGKLGIGDYCVFDNCGSYSIVMKPPFIRGQEPVIAKSGGGY